MDEARAAISRADRALGVLGDETFEEAYQAVYSRYFAEIVTSAQEDVAKRESAYLRIKALTDIRRELRAMVDDGKIAKDRIAHAKALRIA